MVPIYLRQTSLRHLFFNQTIDYQINPEFRQSRQLSLLLGYRFTHYYLSRYLTVASLRRRKRNQVKQSSKTGWQPRNIHLSTHPSTDNYIQFVFSPFSPSARASCVCQPS